MSMSWNTEYRLRRAIRNGDEDIVEETVRIKWVDFDDVREIFEDERQSRRGRIGRFGKIEFGEIEIRDHFGRPRVRR